MFGNGIAGDVTDRTYHPPHRDLNFNNLETFPEAVQALPKLKEL